MKRLLPTFLLLLHLSPCLAQESIWPSERLDLKKMSVGELIEVLDVAKIDEKIRVLDELRGRGNDASSAMTKVVEIGVEIMDAYPLDSSDPDPSWWKISAPLFPALWTIQSITKGDPEDPGNLQAAEFLVDMLRYRGDEIPFQGDQIPVAESALESLDRSALVALAKSVTSSSQFEPLSSRKLLTTISNNIVRRRDTDGLKELREAQGILQDFIVMRRVEVGGRMWSDPKWGSILPASIQALEAIKREGAPDPTFFERGKGLLYVAGLVLLLNVFVILMATRVRWARTLLFHPIGAHILGLVVGKYLLTDFAMHFVKPIRMAMFRDYRSELTTRMKEVWGGRTYIRPQVELSKNNPTEIDGESPRWQSSLGSVMESRMQSLWLIQGESGLGKTALLEQWAMFALQAGQTPLLLRLGGGLRVEEELASSLLQYGEITVKADVARNLINSGGFLILLDAFNEDMHPTATREFVRHAIKNNHVVITSQIRPDWDRLFTIRDLYLRPFGRKQLSGLLPKYWVDQILALDYLSQISAIPYTAQLLARFIEKNDELPCFRIDLYDDMFCSLEILIDRDGLKAMVPNLFDVAAKLFFRNSIFFNTSDRVPIQLCTRAVEAGILTRGVVVDSGLESTASYRFTHELIHRYCVALYLDRQEKSGLDTWHSQVEPEQPKTYWGNVLDFWGELHARRVSRNELPIVHYESFLREAAEFNSEIFSRQMYLQADRFQAGDLIKLSPEFVVWAARTLAVEHF